VILALDSDFLALGPFHLRHARDFAARRRPEAPGAPMNRLYSVEASVSSTGTVADHRLTRRPSEVPRFLADLCARIVLDLHLKPADMPDSLAKALGRLRVARDAGFSAALARDLARAGTQALAVAGDDQPAETHALLHLLHATLGNTDIA